MAIENNIYIRSYVRRQGKMTKAQRASLESLKSIYCVPWLENEFLQLEKLFPEKIGIILEIGFGMGSATAQIAEKNPHIGYLGVEVHTPGVGKLLWEIKQHRLENIRIIHGDAVPLLQIGIKEKSLDGIHIFFPDPWPKKRHHKRRLLTPEFCRILASRLKPSGYIYIATDWEDYAYWILEVLSTVSELSNPYKDFSPQQTWRPETTFETKGKRANREIREILFKKNPQQ
jgi:tRNA (guanine-N7-)-methyltransferase